MTSGAATVAGMKAASRNSFQIFISKPPIFVPSLPCNTSPKNVNGISAVVIQSIIIRIMKPTAMAKIGKTIASWMMNVINTLIRV